MKVSLRDLHFLSSLMIFRSESRQSAENTLELDTFGIFNPLTASVGSEQFHQLTVKGHLGGSRGAEGWFSTEV